MELKAIMLVMMLPSPSRPHRASVAWLVFSASEKMSARIRPKDPRQEHPAFPAFEALPAAPISSGRPKNWGTTTLKIWF